jgi:hypothetical protein
MSQTPFPEQLNADFESLAAARSVVRQFIVERGESYRVTHSNTQRHMLG